MPTSIPSSTIFDSLLAAIKTKFEAITTVQSVIIGTFDPTELSSWAATESSSRFPCIEMIYNGFTGEGYVDQRDIRGNYAFQFVGHVYTATTSRIDGDDMKTVEHLGTAMRQCVYSFIDDTTAPCTWYLFTNPEFTLLPLYQYYDNNINSVILTVSFKCDRADTSA